LGASSNVVINYLASCNTRCTPLLHVQTDLDWQAVNSSDALQTLSELHVRVRYTRCAYYPFKGWQIF